MKEAVEVLTSITELEDTRPQDPFLTIIKDDFGPDSSLSSMSDIDRDNDRVID